MESKISSIQVYFDDLKSYYDNHKDDLNSNTTAASPVQNKKSSQADLQFYWNKKIEQLGSKIG